MNYEFKGTITSWHKSKDLIHDDTFLVRHIARMVQTSMPDEEIEANAHLIAAAPDLLNALINIEKWNVQQAIDQYGDANKANTWFCVVEARKAIHKALNIQP